MWQDFNLWITRTTHTYSDLITTTWSHITFVQYTVLWTSITLFGLWSMRNRRRDE